MLFWGSGAVPVDGDAAVAVVQLEPFRNPWPLPLPSILRTWVSCIWARDVVCDVFDWICIYPPLDRSLEIAERGLLCLAEHSVYIHDDQQSFRVVEDTGNELLIKVA